MTSELKMSAFGANTAGSRPEHDVSTCDCQVRSVPTICGPDGRRETIPLPWPTRIRFWLRKHLNGPCKRAIKRTLTNFVARGRAGDHKDGSTIAARAASIQPHLQAHDFVRVRSRAEIQATLNPWGELKGCSFMDGMWRYCGTSQRVFKTVERFMDERNYQMRKTRGIVLLENVICSGTETLGRCDRSCLYFWREEWLEKVEAEQAVNPAVMN